LPARSFGAWTATSFVPNCRNPFLAPEAHHEAVLREDPVHRRGDHRVDDLVRLVRAAEQKGELDDVELGHLGGQRTGRRADGLDLTALALVDGLVLVSELSAEEDLHLDPAVALGLDGLLVLLQQLRPGRAIRRDRGQLHHDLGRNRRRRGRIGGEGGAPEKAQAEAERNEGQETANEAVHRILAR
jgi:hypothetical protein